MPIKSGTGTITTKAAADYSVDPFTAPFIHDGSGSHPLAAYLRGAAYDEMYSQDLWPSIAVNKLTKLNIQLPGKTYRRQARGRDEARDSAFGHLMAKPSKKMNPLQFWGWFIAMHHIHGCSFARKVRDRLGRPVELDLIHPSRMRYGPEGGGHANVTGLGIEVGPNRWWLKREGVETPIARREFIYWPTFNPASPELGLSPFEPLRQTLENEWNARKANRAMWTNGGKHNIVLKHPNRFNNPKVTEALRQQYADKYGGVEQWGRPLVLQEGMDAVPIPVQADLQYIDTRKLNREEVAAAFDIPPPAIHILDRATFSNVTEQNRMLYRLTMPPILQSFEAMIEFDLRDGRFGESGAPDFGDAFYFEWLVDGVLRGDFEQRIDAFAKAIQTGQITPAEVRELENREFVEGSDRLLINAAVVPVEEASRVVASAVATPLPNDGTSGAVSSLAVADGPLISKLMGRLSRPTELDDIDAGRLVEGLDEHTGAVVVAALTLSKHAGASVAEFRDVVKKLRI